jgi:hypothetical protein
MRHRHSFQATQWEPLEDRKLLTLTVSFPNLGLLLETYVRPEAQVIGTPTPPTLGTPNGFIDSRVTLSKTDVSKLLTAVNVFYAADQSGKNAAAVNTLKASLTSLDQFIATEAQPVAGGGTIHVSNATSHFILPLLNGAAPSAFDVATLHSDVDSFAAAYTPGANTAQNTSALSRLENEMSLLILSHSEGF